MGTVTAILANYTHVISTTSSTQALFGTVFATTANVEYNLDGLAVSGPSADCSIDCLWSLNALTNSTSPSAVMARWGDSYPLLTNQTTWAPVYCAKTQNYCGASIPLYLYYNGKRGRDGSYFAYCVQITMFQTTVKARVMVRLHIVLPVSTTLCLELLYAMYGLCRPLQPFPLVSGWG